LPLQDHIMLLSGRASFELLQKAIMARAQIVCAISAQQPCGAACPRLRRHLGWIPAR
jgi:formate dehydrogenase assembly factor FdhD